MSYTVTLQCFFTFENYNLQKEKCTLLVSKWTKLAKKQLAINLRKQILSLQMQKIKPKNIKGVHYKIEI